VGPSGFEPETFRFPTQKFVSPSAFKGIREGFQLGYQSRHPDFFSSRVERSKPGWATGPSSQANKSSFYTTKFFLLRSFCAAKFFNVSKKTRNQKTRNALNTNCEHCEQQANSKLQEIACSHLQSASPAINQPPNQTPAIKIQNSQFY